MIGHPLATRPSLQGLRPIALRPLPARRSLHVQSIMGGYQYKAKADKLRSKGIDVLYFGDRVLREGCFGEDVLQLQNWLSDESYYNPVDAGYTGYFGSVTKEALQAWQRDHGVDTTGNFDMATKWAYLRDVEAEYLQYTQIATKSTAVAISDAQPVSAASRSSSLGTVVFAAAGLCVAASLARMVPAFYKKATAGIVELFTKPLYPNKKAPTASSGEIYDDFSAAEVYDSAGDEAILDDYAAPAVAKQSPSRQRCVRRLSDEELQRYLAPFKKGKEGSTRPAPFRSAPRRPLVLSSDEGTGSNGAVKSRHGTYYGGQKVLQQVKQYLAEERGGAQTPSPAASAKMQNLGYDMRNGGSPGKLNATNGGKPPTPAKKVPASVSTMAGKATAVGAPLKAMAGSLSSSRSINGSANSSFEDVEIGGSFSNSSPSVTVNGARGSSINGSQALLTGTELETHPEGPLKPVAVQRGNTRTVPSSPGAARRTPARAPAPVPVVKSSTRNTAVEKNPDPEVPIDPNASVVLSHKPVKLHKPARLANGSPDYSSMDE